MLLASVACATCINFSKIAQKNTTLKKKQDLKWVKSSLKFYGLSIFFQVSYHQYGEHWT